MSAQLLLDRLVAACLVVSVLCLLMLAARRPLRRAFGAELAYACWLLLPLLAACCMLPTHHEVVAVRPLPLFSAEQAPVALAATLPAAERDVAGPAVGVWLVGSALALLLAALRQRRFVRALGPLTAQGDGVFVSESDAGPLLIGLFAPRIVLPPDFAMRYDAGEQALVLEHERAHCRRGDLLANMLAELMLALFWFNPLAYRARRAFLLDQEMACDATVLRRCRASQKAYANALLKTQTTAARLPVGCTMHAHQPIKERIMNLNQQAPGAVVRRLFQGAVAAAAIGAGCAAWAMTAEQVMVETPSPVALAAPAPVAPAAPVSTAPAAPRAIAAVDAKAAVVARPAVSDTLLIDYPGTLDYPAKPAAAPSDDGKVYQLSADISIDGGPAHHEEMAVKNSFAFAGLSDGDGKPCELSGQVHAQGADVYYLAMKVACAGEPMSTPGLLVKAGEATTLSFGRNVPPADSAPRTRGFVLKLRVDRG